jgi:hypothetical protein
VKWLLSRFENLRTHHRKGGNVSDDKMPTIVLMNDRELTKGRWINHMITRTVHTFMPGNTEKSHTIHFTGLKPVEYGDVMIVHRGCVWQLKPIEREGRDWTYELKGYAAVRGDIEKADDVFVLHKLIRTKEFKFTTAEIPDKIEADFDEKQKKSTFFSLATKYDQDDTYHVANDK